MSETEYLIQDFGYLYYLKNTTKVIDTHSWLIVLSRLCILRLLLLIHAVNDMPSKQFTTVPFRTLLTGLTTILDTSGELSDLQSRYEWNSLLMVLYMLSGFPCS